MFAFLGTTCDVDPGIPDNGARDNTPPYMSGMQVRYMCNPGYVLMGDSNTLTCQNDGNWLGVLPSCNSKFSPFHFLKVTGWTSN